MPPPWWLMSILAPNVGELCAQRHPLPAETPDSGSISCQFGAQCRRVRAPIATAQEQVDQHQIDVELEVVRV